MRLFLSVAFIAFGFPAFTIAPCLPHDEMAKFLADQFREQQRFVGLDQGGNMLELWFRPRRHIYGADNGTRRADVRRFCWQRWQHHRSEKAGG